MNNLMNKKVFFVATLWMVAMAMFAQQITLDDVANYKYSPKSVREVTPLADGESYACVSEDSKRIERCSFKTGEVTETLF